MGAVRGDSEFVRLVVFEDLVDRRKGQGPPGLRPRQTRVPVKPFLSMRSFNAARSMCRVVKDSLRRHFRALRDAVPGPKQREAARRISEHIQGLDEWREAAVVLLYASFGSEVDTRPLLEAAWGQGKKTALPRIDGKQLTVQLVDRETRLVPNRYGIPEPPADTPAVPGDDVDLAVVPGIAFDRRGGRLGYGGGYYDRLLGTVPHAFRVGIAYEVQVVEHLPTSHLDVPMDALVTVLGVHLLPRREH